MVCDGFTYFSQAVGVTSALPQRVPRSLCYDRYGSYYQASSNEWIYRGNQLLHNETETDFGHLPSLDDLRPGDSVGLLIDTTGNLHIFFNGTSSGTIAIGLPISKGLWGVASVENYYSKIKSEMLSGMLDCVSM